jgi:hypothetical protein
VLFLPPRSGYRTHWTWPVDHRDTGVLSVPPLSSGPTKALHAAVPLAGSLRPENESASIDRTPVRI